MPQDTPYRPISCDFHDRLEDTATRRSTAHIVYQDEDGQPHEVESAIADLVNRGGEEYMVLRSGNSIRLDRIVSVDGVRLSDYGDAGHD